MKNQFIDKTQVDVQVVQNPDVILQKKAFVITTDAIILNKCKSWINLLPVIIDNKLNNLQYLDLQ